MSFDERLAEVAKADQMSASHAKTIFEILGRHPIHPFPARMAPGIALDFLAESKSAHRVLDPMVGSGTVLAVAKSRGHRAFGVDLDPLAVLLARVWTSAVRSDSVHEKAEQVLARAKARFDRTPSRLAYPKGHDVETAKFIRYWFDENARRQLFALAESIGRVHDAPMRDALWCGFSRLIITKKAGASRAMDLSHSRPHRKYARALTKPFDRFVVAVDTVAKNCHRDEPGSRSPETSVARGDARRLDHKSGSIDLVLTSPPYLNAIDYLRCSKFSLVWMGWNLESIRTMRGESVGANSGSERASLSPRVKEIVKDLKLNPPLGSRDGGVLARYVWDMDKALAETSRVLKPGGRAVYVVGDSTIRGTFVRNSEIVEQLAASRGLALDSKSERDLPKDRRYLPPPRPSQHSSDFDLRMRKEVVLVLDKGLAA